MSQRTAPALIVPILTLVIAMLILSISSQHAIRWDLNKDQRFTLSDDTLTALDSLKAPLYIYAFLPMSAPGTPTLLMTQIHDTIDDLQRHAPNIQIEIFDTSPQPNRPELSEEVQQKAKDLHIPFKRISQRTSSQLFSAIIPFGIALSSGRHQAVITPPERIEEIEGRFLNALLELKGHQKTFTIGVSQANGEPDLIRSPLLHTLSLGAQLIAVDPSKDPLIDRIDSLLILGPSKTFNEIARYHIDQLLCDGGGVVFALDYKVQSQAIPKVWPQTNVGLLPLLSAHGIDVQWRSVVGDTKNQSPARLHRDAQGMILTEDHFLYPRVNTKSHPITDRIKQIVFPMGAPIIIDDPHLPASQGISSQNTSTSNPPVTTSSITPILTSSKHSIAFSKLSGIESTDPSASQTVGSFTLGVAIHRYFSAKLPIPQDLPPQESILSTCSQATQAGRLTLFTSGRRFLSAHPQNIDLLRNAVDWVSHRDTYIRLRGKHMRRAHFSINAVERKTIQWLGALSGPFFILLISAWVRRRSAH